RDLSQRPRLRCARQRFGSGHLPSSVSERELPAVPDPPSFGPDPRQEMFYTVIGRLVPALSHPESQVRVAATSTGFPASAVDLGRLQTEIERAFAGWSSKEIRSRWRSDVFAWISRFTRTWRYQKATRCQESLARYSRF